MTMQDIQEVLPSQSFLHVRGLVAKALIDHAEDILMQRSGLSQREIARMIGSDRVMVYLSLKSLQDKGAIRIDDHRIKINKELLRTAAGLALYA
jgi:hypothetical protein